jgi:hypothetical protein
MTGPQHSLLRESAAGEAVVSHGSASSPKAKLASNAVEVATNGTIDKTIPRNVEFSMPFVAQSRRNVSNVSLALPVSHDRASHGKPTHLSKANQDVANEKSNGRRETFLHPCARRSGFA